MEIDVSGTNVAFLAMPRNVLFWFLYLRCTLSVRSFFKKETGEGNSSYLNARTSTLSNVSTFPKESI